MEGPSLLILREELQEFAGQKVLTVRGNTQQPKELLKGRVLSGIDTWAKVLFLTFTSPKKNVPPIVTKTHFLMFGSYRINDPRPGRDPRLELKFKSGTLYLYACSLKFDAEEYQKAVDREVDLMSEDWNEKHVVALMGKKQKSLLCDLLLDQQVFAGSGNIVKNEVLFNLRRHPLTPLSKVPKKDWPKIARAVHDYMWNFYEWKKKFVLRKHWQVMRKGSCPLCGEKLVKGKMGKLERRTFYCARHQPLPARAKPLRVHAVLPPKPSSKPARRREPRLDH